MDSVLSHSFACDRAQLHGTFFAWRRLLKPLPKLSGEKELEEWRFVCRSSKPFKPLVKREVLGWVSKNPRRPQRPMRCRKCKASFTLGAELECVFVCRFCKEGLTL